MDIGANSEIIQILFQKLRIFAGRPHVQFQILAILACLLLAAFMTITLHRWTHEATSSWIARQTHRRMRRPAMLVFRLIEAVSFPIYGLILLEVMRRVLIAQGFITGILFQFNWLLTTLFGFQIVIAVLYGLFDAHEVRRYHYRFMLPLLVLFFCLAFLNNLVSLTALAAVQITQVFENPITIGAIFLATVGLYFWIEAVNGFQDLTHKFLVQRTELDAGSAKATLTLFRYIFIIIGLLFAFSQFQLDATTIAAITGGLSVGIGFGLREVLSNFVSGLILLFERSLHPGDVIEIDDELSIVENLSIRATTVRTRNNVEVVIPNQTFFTSSFRTYTGSDRTVRIPIDVKTDCQIDPRAVIQILIDTALSHGQVLSEPKPSVFVLEYADNVAEFQLNVWIDDPMDSAKISSEVLLLVWDAFEQNNIALPFPETEVHFTERNRLVIENQSANGLAPQAAVAATGAV